MSKVFRRIKKNTFIDHVLTVIIFLTVLPLVFTKIIPIIKLYVVWYVFFVFAWVLITFLIRPGYYLKPSLYRLIVFLLIAATVIIPLVDSNYILAGRFTAFTSVFVFYLFYEFNRLEGKGHVSYRVIYMLVPFFIFTCINTIVALELSPYISRGVKSSGQETFDIYSKGIGGYDFIYSAVVLFPVLFYFSINKSYKMMRFNRFLCVFMMLLVFILVVKSNYFTALIVVLSSSLLMVFIVSIQSKYRGFGFIFLFSLIFLAAVLFLSIDMWVYTAYDIVDQYFGSAISSQRIKAILSYLAYGDSLNSVKGRDGMLSLGVSAAVEYFPFGLMFTYDNYKFEYIITHHSFLLDVITIFGVIGCIYIFCIFYPFMQRLLYKRVAVLFPVFFSFLIISVFNNFSYSIGFSAFFITLLLIDDEFVY